MNYIFERKCEFTNTVSQLAGSNFSNQDTFRRCKGIPVGLSSTGLITQP